VSAVACGLVELLHSLKRKDACVTLLTNQRMSQTCSSPVRMNRPRLKGLRAHLTLLCPGPRRPAAPTRRLPLPDLRARCGNALCFGTHMLQERQARTSVGLQTRGFQKWGNRCSSELPVWCLWHVSPRIRPPAGSAGNSAQAGEEANRHVSSRVGHPCSRHEIPSRT
jgi:hypothetical protein